MPKVVKDRKHTKPDAKHAQPDAQADDDEDHIPCPRALVTTAIAKHNVNGKRMLALAAKGVPGAIEMAALCDGYTALPVACQELLQMMCYALLQKFQQQHRDYVAKPSTEPTPEPSTEPSTKPTPEPQTA